MKNNCQKYKNRKNGKNKKNRKKIDFFFIN